MKKISTLQICSIAYCLILSNNIGLTTYIMFHYAKQDCIVSIIIGSILGLIPLFLYLKIMNYKPDLNIIKKIDVLFPRAGKLINMILFFVIAYFITINLYNLVNFISSQYLSKTPSIIISLSFLIPVVYVLKKGVTVIGRTTFILVLISFIFLFFTVLGLVWQVRIDNVLPLFEQGFNTPFITSLLYVLYNISPLFLLTIIPLNDIVDKDKFNKRIVIAYVFANIVVYIVFFLTIAVLGPNLTILYQYPEYDVLKKVSLVGFIERTESTISLRWLFYIFVTVVMGVKYLREYISHVFKINNEKTNNKISFLTTLVIIISSNYIFKSSVESNLFIYYKLPYLIVIIFILLPFLIMFRSKKN